MPALNPKQTRFVDEYLVDLNASAAALRSGYSKKTAYAIGHENLKKPHIAQAIAERQKALAVRNEISRDEVIGELAKLARSNMADYFTVNEDGQPQLDFSKLTREQASCLHEMTVEEFTEGRGRKATHVRKVKFKLYDKRAALVDLGKGLGFLIDKHEHSGPKGGPIELADVTDREFARRVAFVLNAGLRPAIEATAAKRIE